MKEASMNGMLKLALLAAGLAAATHAAAQVTFDEHEQFEGRSFTTEDGIGNFKQFRSEVAPTFLWRSSERSNVPVHP
jgi:hypothetical protein